MKATIDNVTIEGTPEEIHKFIKLYKVDKTIIKNPTYPNPYWKSYFGDKIDTTLKPYYDNTTITPYTVGDPPLGLAPTITCTSKDTSNDDTK